MPSTTFRNLSPAKRGRVLRAAIAEFASRGYPAGNLDRVAGAARVPKGSLYQYFDDKQDLFAAAARAALARTWHLFERHLAERPTTDCFGLLREAILFMVELREREPDLALLYARIVFLEQSDLQERLLAVYEGYSARFHARFRSWGVEAGLIDPALPAPLVRFVVHAVGARVQQMILTGERPGWLRGPPPGGYGAAWPAFVDQLVARLRAALAPRP